VAWQVTPDIKPFGIRSVYALAQVKCDITGRINRKLERVRKEQVKGLMMHFP